MTLVDIDPLKERIDKEVKEGKVLDGWAFFFKVYLDDALIIDADRPKGEWIEHKWKEYNEELMMSFPCHNYECSECSFHAHEPTNFCPNCGARMKGAK